MRVSLFVIFRRLSHERAKMWSPSTPRSQRARCNDDCIILIVNAISRAEFDEFTTRFYEDTERTFRGRRCPRFSPSLYLSSSLLSLSPSLCLQERWFMPDVTFAEWIYIPIFIIRNIIARAFIALVEIPSPRRDSTASSSFSTSPLRATFFLSFLSFFSSPSRTVTRAPCDLPDPFYQYSHLKRNIYCSKMRH